MELTSSDLIRIEGRRESVKPPLFKDNSMQFWEKTLDDYPDDIITKVEQTEDGRYYYATLDWGDYEFRSADFSSCAKTSKDAVKKCAKKIRDDARGIGKYAPHSCLIPGYTLYFVLFKHWEKKMND